MVILNMIIAFLSNLFTALDNVQGIIEIKEKAKMTLDLETILRFFKTIARRPLDEAANKKFVFIVQPKEKDHDFSLDQINSDKEVVLEQNRRAFNGFRDAIERQLKENEGKMMAYLEKMQGQLEQIERKVKTNGMFYRQQNFSPTTSNLKRPPSR